MRSSSIASVEEVSDDAEDLSPSSPHPPPLLALDQVVVRRDASDGAYRLRLSDLPDEIIAEVCSHLSASSDLKAMSRACRAFRLEAQKRLYNSVTLYFDFVSKKGRYSAADKRGKIRGLLRLPFAIRSLRLVAHQTETHSYALTMRDRPNIREVLQNQKEALGFYLAKMRLKCNITSFTLEFSSRMWVPALVEALTESKHSPTRLKLESCIFEAFTLAELKGLLSHWPSCSTFDMAPFTEYNEYYSHSHGYQDYFSDDEDYSVESSVSTLNARAFFKLKQPQLSVFVLHSGLWDSPPPAAFYMHMRALHIGSSCSSDVLRLVKEVRQGEIMVEELEMWRDISEEDEEMWMRGDTDAGELRSPSNIISLLHLCTRLRIARLELTKYDMAEFESMQPPTSVEHLEIVYTSVRLHIRPFERLVHWICDRAASPALESLQIHHGWARNEAAIRECSQVDYKFEFRLDEDSFWESIEDDDLCLRTRYFWDPDSAVDDDDPYDEDELQTIATFRCEDAVQLVLDRYRRAAARGRRALEARGIPYVLEKPFVRQQAGALVQQTL